jgi:hypothetical protein
MSTFLFVLAAMCFLSAIVWTLGWHYGARTFRDRNRMLHQALENHRLEMEMWSKSTPASNWQAGYIEGQKNTLDAIDSFVANHQL